MKLKTHVCLVSGQPTPNLIPALDPSFRPRRVILMVSPDMQRQADWLRKALVAHGLKTRILPVEDAWNIAHLKSRFAELLKSEAGEADGGGIALNVTGGTKPMSIAAYDIFRAAGLPIFYVHPEKDRIDWLHPAQRESMDLADRIRIESLVRAHGFELTREPGRNVPDAALLRVGEEILREIERFQKPLGTLNWLASTARGSLLSRELDDHSARNEDLDCLIDLFARNGFLDRQGSSLRFPDEDARFFANGGWLEYTVFDAVRRLRRQDAHIHDIVRSLELQRGTGKKAVPNEIDVALLRNNRLHLIECKARRFVGSGEDSPGAEALYKLDTLADLTGGLQARAMLISFRDLSGHDRRRARELGIHVCAGQQLRNLSSLLARFIAD
jgi:hypothetical protein